MARHQLPNQPRSTSRVRACFAIAYRRWYVALLPVLVLPAVLVAVSNSQPPVYEATAQVVLGPDSASDSASDSGAGIDVVSEAGIAGGDTVRQVIAEQLDMAPDDLPAVDVVANADLNALDFTATGSTPTEAAFYANIWANTYAGQRVGEQEQKLTTATETLQSELDGFRDERRELRSEVVALQSGLNRSTDPSEIEDLERQIDSEERAISDDLAFLDAEIAATVDALTRLDADAAVGTASPATITHQATAPAEPISRSLIPPVLSGIAAGLLLGLTVALLVDRLDRSVRSLDDIAHLGVPILGAIPAASRKLVKDGLATVIHTHADTPMADAYQKLRSAVQFAMCDRGLAAAVVTSPGRAEGRTTTAVNLALGVAGMKRKVVLADTDFRHPQIHTLFDAAPTPGLNDALLNEVPLAQIALKHRRLPSTLAALPAGHEPPEPSTYLTSCAFGWILAELDTQCDLVVIDAPPVLADADGRHLASYTGGVVLVARAGRTKMKDLKRAIASIQEAGGHLLGIVLNGERRWTKLFRPTLRLAEPPAGPKPPLPVKPSVSEPSVSERRPAPKRPQPVSASGLVPAPLSASATSAVAESPATNSTDTKTSGAESPAAEQSASALPVSERQPRQGQTPMPKRAVESPERPLKTPERPVDTGIHQVERPAPTRRHHPVPASKPAEHQPKQPVGAAANEAGDAGPAGRNGIHRLMRTGARLKDRTPATTGRASPAEAVTEPTDTPSETKDDLAPVKS